MSLLIAVVTACYPLPARLPRQEVFTLFGPLTGEVVSARYAPARGAPQYFVATGKIEQAMIATSHAEGEGFALRHVRPKSWVSFEAELRVGERTETVECFDR